MSSDKKALPPVAAKETSGWRSAFGLNTQLVKGAIVGGVTATLLSGFVFNAKPASASAAVLIPSLGTIISEITQYYNVMLNYVDQWVPDLSGIINTDDWSKAKSLQGDVDNVMQDANRQLAAYHAEGGGPYLDAVNEQLKLVRNSTGRIDPEKAADYMTPPGLLSSSSTSSDDLNKVRNYSTLLTGDAPLKEVRTQYQDTLAGTNYEYSRVQALQNRLLAQDAVQQYSLAGPMINGYREHLEQLEDNGALSSMTPGQLLAAQLDIMVHVQAPASVDTLQSSLRQERMLGALLAQEIKPDIDDLIANRAAAQ